MLRPPESCLHRQRPADGAIFLYQPGPAGVDQEWLAVMAEADLLAEVGALDGRVADDARALPPAEQERTGSSAECNSNCCGRRRGAPAAGLSMLIASCLLSRCPLTRYSATTRTVPAMATRPNAATRTTALRIASMPAECRQRGCRWHERHAGLRPRPPQPRGNRSRPATTGRATVISMAAPRSLVLKVTVGKDDPERCNQALTVAAAAAASGVPVSLWLTGEASWMALPDGLPGPGPAACHSAARPVRDSPRRRHRHAVLAVRGPP